MPGVGLWAFNGRLRRFRILPPALQPGGRTGAGCDPARSRYPREPGQSRQICCAGSPTGGERHNRVDASQAVVARDIPEPARVGQAGLVLHGADDQIIPLQEAESMRDAIPNARLQVLPEAGHLLNLEQPDLFNQAIKGFIHDQR